MSIEAENQTTDNVESADNTQEVEISAEELQKQVSEYQAQLDDYKSQVEKVNNKNKELIAERRKDQERKKALEEEARRAEELKMKESENYKDYSQSLEQKIEKLTQDLEETRNTYKTKEQKALAYKLASQVASGARAEDLAEFHLRNRIVENEDGSVMYKNSEGKVVYTDAEDLLEEIKSSERYQHLIDAPKSSGGGASGNTSSASKTKVISKADFDSMSPRQQIDFQKKGGRYDPNL